MSYTRVIPRDLFNEAKLLKCMGFLCLAILDKKTPVEMSFDDEFVGEYGFRIGLWDDGGLEVTNLTVCIKDVPYLFRTTYNSKETFPLHLFYDNCEYRVFDEAGNWDVEFIEFVNSL